VRVPLSWLREFLDIDVTPEQLAERLTLLGMEVKAIERWGDDWGDVVVGELLAVDRHPRADRLSLARVTVGNGEALDIVCGATNIAVGQRIPVALPGAVLPGGRRIERAEKMGVVSNGMLCSGDELRMTTDADGILILPADTPLGRPLVDLYGDIVLDVDVKPNRGDALSIVGLAREVAAATGQRVRQPEIDVEEGSGPGTADRLVIDIEDRALCPRFVGRWVSGVRVGPSPDHVQMRLLAAGLRPVSNVVDASNYVMVELGKPIHTFDAAAVRTGPDGRAAIMVRPARGGETLETLDHVTRTLDTDDLLIADAAGPLAIAGVMGGSASEVSDATTEVVIESAVFDPVSIRRTAQRHALRSEASSRFEKGQELRLARIGADRTAELIRAWAGGSIALGRVDTAPDEPGRLRVTFRPGRINRLLGTALEAAEMQELLDRVEIETQLAGPGEPVVVATAPAPLVVDPEPGTAFVALVPTWRRDIAIESDVVEEVARVRGYELVPSVTPDTGMPRYRPSPLEVRDLVRETLAGAGLTEVVTPALVSPRHLETFGLLRPVPSIGDEPQPVGSPVLVTNPLSRDHSLLRQGLIGSLLDVVSTNLRHGTDDVAIFEVGKGYARDGDETREWWRLGFALTGAAAPLHHDRVARPYDIDDAKGIIALLCRRLGFDRPVYQPESGEPVFHPGRTARVAAATGPADTRPGAGGHGLEAIVGELHPSVPPRWDLRGSTPVIVGEVALSGLAEGQLAAWRAPAVPRFPAVDRDLAVVIDASRPAGEVEDMIRRNAGSLLRHIRLFDVYRGAPLADTDKSLAYRLTFQADDRTLTEDEVDAAVHAVTGALGAIGGRLRT
jgi:phenylalanyl-tRNA synthetase beta chain